MVARFVRDEEAAGSNPASPTTQRESLVTVIPFFHDYGNIKGTTMKRSILALASGAFVLGAAEFVMMGILPQAAAAMGVDIPTAGNYISSYAIGVCVGTLMLVFGRRVPPKKLILRGCLHGQRGQGLRLLAAGGAQGARCAGGGSGWRFGFACGGGRRAGGWGGGVVLKSRGVGRDNLQCSHVSQQWRGWGCLDWHSQSHCIQYRHSGFHPGSPLERRAAPSQ